MPRRTETLDCPLCGPAEFVWQFEKKGRGFWRCRGCGIERQAPLPTHEELAAYYEQSYASGMYQDFVAADEMKRMTARQRIKEIERTAPIEGDWLDVGCANGVLVEALAERGVRAEGVELSERAVEIGRERGLTLHVGTADDLPAGRKYDGVTAFDVVEHVLDPRGFLEGLAARLKPGGRLVLTAPDTGAMVRRLMGRRWFFYIPEEHLHYFTRRNLGALCEAVGLRVEVAGATHKPMTYDYAMTQFKEYNPGIYGILKTLSYAVPSGLRSKPAPLPIGELRVIARAPDA